MSSPALVPTDQQARRRALTPDVSYLVQAPAGSGKTSLLTQRFLRLLALAGQPEEILAITFTRKAAAEMRSRILGELRAARQGRVVLKDFERETRGLADAALARDAAQGWGILESPHRLRIQTLDSFQASLVKRLPLHSTFGMAADSTDRAKPIYLNAVRQTLIAMAQGPERDGVIRILNLFDNKLDTLSESLAKLVAQREQWLPILGSDPLRQDAGQLRATLEAGMEAVLVGELQRIRQRMPLDHTDALVRCAHWAAEEDLEENVAAVLAGLTGWPAASAAALPQWRTLADWLLTKDGDVRKRGGINKKLGFPEKGERKQAMCDLVDALALIPGFAGALDSSRNLPEPVYSDADWQVLAALLQFAAQLLPRLWLEFGLRGETDFTEVSLRALAALGAGDGTPTLLAERLDARIQHVLVDEFQDTSVLQMQLLRKLTENWTQGDGRTLFLVGDPMQSIYYWRNARVDLFLRAWAGDLRGLPPLETLRLTRNFRSCPPLIATFNDFFGAQFPALDNAEEGAVRYSPAATEPHAGDGEAAAAFTPHVHYHAFLAADSSAEAAWIAEEVDRIQQENPDQPPSIGILFRAKEHARPVAAALQARGIRYQAVDIDPLASLPVVQDLRAMLAALLFPLDRVSWLAVLRAPWNGLTLRELAHVASLAQSGPIYDALPDALEPHPALDEDARQRLRRTRTLFAEALEWRGRLPLAQVLSGLWQRSGAAAYHADSRSRMAADAFLQALQRVEEGDLLASLEPMDEILAELQAPADPEAPATLQLLTIHKAKGLEFNTVFLPALHRKAPTGAGPALAWEEVPLTRDTADNAVQLAVLLAPRAAPGEEKSRIYEWVEDRKRTREKNESLRVLYVGFTRAREHLHLLATLDPTRCNAAAELKAHAGSYLHKLWDRFAPRFAEAWEAHVAAPAAAPALTYSPLRRMQSAALPALLPSAESSATQAAGRGERFFRPEGGFETLDTAAGTVFHRLMQRVDPARWATAAAAADRLQPLVREELRALLPGELALDAAITRIVEAFRRAAQSPIAREIFLPTHQDVASEQSIAYREGSQLRSARIDRLYRDVNGLLHVVDFKLSDGDAAEAAGFLAAQRSRYQSQLEGYARLLRQERAEAIRLLLYYPLQDLADSWELAPQAQHA